jgi:hypothetical protein
MKNTKRNLSMFASLLGLLGCSDSTIENAKRTLERDLKDPQSVQYREVRSFQSGSVCGEFNAKNSYGAYTGFKPFVFDGRKILETPDRSLHCTDNRTAEISRRTAFARENLEKLKLQMDAAEKVALATRLDCAGKKLPWEQATACPVKAEEAYARSISEYRRQQLELEELGKSHTENH